MRISLRHEITCRFDKPVSSILRVLRITPWAIECQHLDTWRIDLNCDCRLRSGDDAFGNIVDTINADQPLEALAITAQGEIVTTDTSGVLRNALERFPPDFYLRDTDITVASESLREFADKAVSGKTDPLGRLHALLVAVCNEMEVASAGETSPALDAIPTASDAFRDEKGSARDIAHVFIAAARHIGAPARFVSGALVPEKDPETTDASHSWAEAYAPGVGWIGFDPVQGLCTHEGHIRIAFALDHLGASAMRSAPIFGVTEKTDSRLIAREARTIQSRQERSFGMRQEQFQK